MDIRLFFVRSVSTRLVNKNTSVETRDLTESFSKIALKTLKLLLRFMIEYFSIK